MSDQSRIPAPTEIPCPECGEMVRPGLVRCWNCGAFMRRELEQKYLELQAGPKKVFFSPLPADADIHAVAVDSSDDDDEDDFVLEPQGFVPHLKSESAPAGDATPASAAHAQAADASGAPADVANGPSVAHSVATGGDALFDIAMREEAESQRKRKKSRRSTGGARTATGFIIFCPYGCKIEVRDQHRGMTGKCPKCRAPFLVPVDPPDYNVAKEKVSDGEAAPAVAPGGIKTWLNDVHVHRVNPLKLKLKPGGLAKDFTDRDFGFSPERLLVAAFSKKAAGLFGGGDKKKVDPRDALLAHLRENKPLEELTGVELQVFSVDDVRQMRIVQPAASRMDSMFHGIPVFGEHRVAVQLPTAAEQDPQFAWFPLLQFRQFSQALDENYGLERFGADLGIPLQDEFQPFKCHYTDAMIKALSNVEWYQADPQCKLTLAGWKCDGCGLVVSEDARKKEKLGGANGKALAKTPCPKCKKKFGEHPLYVFADAGAESAPTMAGEGAPAMESTGARSSN